MGMVRRCCSLAAVFLLFASPGHAEPQSSNDKEARKLFFQGDRMYEEGKYEEAVEAFEKAYQLSRRPELLFNLANAYERLGQYEEALRALRDYAPAAPKDDRERIAARLKTLEERAEERRSRAEKEKAVATPAPAPAPAETKPSEPAPEEPASKPPILAYTLLGVGAVGVGVGVFFGVQAMGAKSDAEEQCGGASGNFCRASAQGSIDDASSRALIADIAFAAGAVAAGAGVVLLLTHRGSNEKENAAALHAAPRPGGGEVQFVAQF
jgi:tetratricopeptide (TPR) repeat protein